MEIVTLHHVSGTVTLEIDPSKINGSIDDIVDCASFTKVLDLPCPFSSIMQPSKISKIYEDQEIESEYHSIFYSSNLKNNLLINTTCDIIFVLVEDNNISPILESDCRVVYVTKVTGANNVVNIRDNYIENIVDFSVDIILVSDNVYDILTYGYKGFKISGGKLIPEESYRYILDINELLIKKVTE